MFFVFLPGMKGRSCGEKNYEKIPQKNWKSSICFPTFVVLKISTPSKEGIF